MFASSILTTCLIRRKSLGHNHRCPDKSMCAYAIRLPVIRMGTVFPVIVLIKEKLINGGPVLVQANRIERHLCDNFKDNRVIDRILGIFPPAKRRVIGDENAWHGFRIESQLCKGFDDY